MILSLLSITDLIGHFHPVLVHLPLGILLLGAFMQLLLLKEKYQPLQPAVAVIYLAGSITAVLSCISGWLLAGNGGYDENTLFYHRWMGISVAIVATIAYWLSRRSSRVSIWLAPLLFLLLLITGHLGGTLTHGEGYLTKGVFDTKDTLATIKPIADAQEAWVYKDIIQPVLAQKCYSCHAAAKQKGSLRVDGEEWILKGGKDGPVVTPGNPESSELYKRIVLDPLEEKHMPPRGKPQMSEQDRVLLHWWIKNGLNFSARSKQLPQTPQVTTALQALQTISAVQKNDVPDQAVDKAPDSAIAVLHRNGITISPVFVGSNYLSANFVTVQSMTQEMMDALSMVKEQLIWLKMPGIRLMDGQWKQIGALRSLNKISIERSNILDTTLGYLGALSHLQYLNLVGTDISVKGLRSLKIPGLETIYLAQSHITKEELTALKPLFPSAKIDIGGYTVETLVTDTTLLKKTVKK